MADRIGPTFTAELAAAGVALDGLSWLLDGTLSAADAGHLAAAGAVLAKHDPTQQPVPPRRATLAALFDPLSAAQRAAITADHLMRLQADAATVSDGTVYIGSSKVARAAVDLSLTPDAWFKLAGA